MTARSVGSAIDEGTQPNRNVRFSAGRGKADVARTTHFGSDGPIRDMSKMFPSDIIHAVPEFIWEMSGYELERGL
jgi:hypothetical protein